MKSCNHPVWEYKTKPVSLFGGHGPGWVIVRECPCGKRQIIQYWNNSGEVINISDGEYTSRVPTFNKSVLRGEIERFMERTLTVQEAFEMAKMVIGAKLEKMTLEEMIAFSRENSLFFEKKQEIAP